MPDFSYQSNVAPYASKFFDDVGADSRLSSSAKARIQGTLLDGMDDIEMQRNKLESQRLGLASDRQAFELGGLKLEAARDRRAKVSNASGIAKGILDSADDPETKRQKLARAALDHADDDDAVQTFGLANKALPEVKKADYTSMQVADMTAKLVGRVAPEDMAQVMGNPSLLGSVLGEIAKKDENEKEAKRLRDDKSEKALALKSSLATKTLKFAKPPADANTEEWVDAQGKPRWLDDDSTSDARQIIGVLGTAEDQKAFEELKDSSSDRARALLIHNVQLRHQLEIANGSSAPSGGKAKGYSLVR